MASAPYFESWGLKLSPTSVEFADGHRLKISSVDEVVGLNDGFDSALSRVFKIEEVQPFKSGNAICKGKTDGENVSYLALIVEKPRWKPQLQISWFEGEGVPDHAAFRSSHRLCAITFYNPVAEQ